MSEGPSNPIDSSREGGKPDQFFRELNIQFLVHELKGPLAIIEAGVRFLLEKEGKSGPLSPRQEKTLKRVLRGAVKGRSLLNNLLEIGRSEEGQFIRTSFYPAKTIFVELLESIESMDWELFELVSEMTNEREVLNFLNQAGISFQVASGADGIEIIQDETKYCHVVGNLITNALRFRKEKVTIKLFREGESIVVEVSDDGPGIRKEDHNRIFRPYVQAEVEGSLARKGHGLGLAGALVLARGLGGNISVQSEVGRGATFRFTVPLK